MSITAGDFQESVSLIRPVGGGRLSCPNAGTSMRTCAKVYKHTAGPHRRPILFLRLYFERDFCFEKSTRNSGTVIVVVVVVVVNVSVRDVTDVSESAECPPW